MLKFVLGLGIALTSTSVALGFDYNAQMAAAPGEGLSFETYAGRLPVRLTSMAKVNAAKASNAIPVITETWTGKRWSDLDNDEQIANFTNSDPNLKRVVAAVEEQSRQSFWASVRQKFAPEDKKAGNRLADIKARTAARNYQPTIQPSDLSGMSATQLYGNRSEISRSFTAIAKENMNAASKGF